MLVCPCPCFLPCCCVGISFSAQLHICVACNCHFRFLKFATRCAHRYIDTVCAKERESKRRKQEREIDDERKTAAISLPTFSFPRLGASHESIIHHHRLSKSRPWPSCTAYYPPSSLNRGRGRRRVLDCRRDFIVMIFAACNGALEGLWPASQNSRNNKRVQFSFPAHFQREIPV